VVVRGGNRTPAVSAELAVVAGAPYDTLDVHARHVVQCGVVLADRAGQQAGSPISRWADRNIGFRYGWYCGRNVQ
jgi:hypothetical protein